MNELLQEETEGRNKTLEDCREGADSGAQNLLEELEEMQKSAGDNDTKTPQF